MKGIKTIDIVSVDTETVVEDASFLGAYAFYIKLSGKPERQWIVIFKHEWEQSPYLMKREISVIGDQLRLVCAQEDTVQNHVAFARDLVKKTNSRVEEANRRRELAEKWKRGRRQEIEKEKDEIRRKLRETSLE